MNWCRDLILARLASLLHQLRSHKVRVFKTTCMAACTLVHGMHAGTSGPALVHLKRQVDSEAASYLVSAESTGFILGTFLCALWYPRANFQLVSGILWLGVAAAHAVLPFLSSLWSLLLTYLVIGALMGTYETGCIVFLSILWGTMGLPVRQAVVLIRGAGSALAPLVLQSFAPSSSPPGVMPPSPQEQLPSHQLLWTFAVITGVSVAAGLLTLAAYCLYPETRDHPSRLPPEPGVRARGSGKSDPAVSCKSNSVVWKGAMLTLVSGFIFFDCAIDVSIRNFVASYVMREALLPLPLPEAPGRAVDREVAGGLLTSAFFAAATATRVAGLLIVSLIGIESTFLVSLGLLVLATGLLVGLGSSSLGCLFAAVALTGVATANNVPCIYAHMENAFPITSGISSGVGLTSQLSYILFPLLLAHLMPQAPSALPFSVLTCTVVLLILLPTLLLVSRRRPLRLPLP